jgi:hypothetical protein
MSFRRSTTAPRCTSTSRRFATVYRDSVSFLGLHWILRGPVLAFVHILVSLVVCLVVCLFGPVLVPPRTSLPSGFTLQPLSIVVAFR